MNYDLNEGLLQNTIENVIEDYARVYDINYTVSFPCDLLRFYYFDDKHEHFVCNVKVNNHVNLIEGISFIINIFKELGLDPLLDISGPSFLQKHLAYLDIDSNITDSKDIKLSISDDNNLLAEGSLVDNFLVIKCDILKIRSLMKPNNPYACDVCIIGKSEEEELKASIIMQDLRLNNIICRYQDTEDKIDDYEVKHLIIIKDDELNKGLVTVKDHLTKEEKQIPEDEIIDYILGVI